jgi:polysaccharide biosynthesis/export protein
MSYASPFQNSILSFICAGFFVLSGCQAVPNDGPLTSDIVSDKQQKDGAPYSLIDLTGQIVSKLDAFDYLPLEKGFGFGRPTSLNSIGPGDVLNVTIFEAGPDGVFSTADKKSVNVDLTIQENGRISIPFAGTVKAAGQTLEQLRQAIAGQLKGRAVEPDVIVNVKSSSTNAVVVNGDVRSASKVALITGRERILDVIGQAGGPSNPPYDTYISLSRGKNTRTSLLQTLIDKPRENIHVQKDDAIYLSYDPRTFLALGAVGKKGKHKFGTGNLSLAGAIGIAEGLEDARSNPAGYFIFRYEYKDVIKKLVKDGVVPADSVSRLVDNPNVVDDLGRIPVVYRIDLKNPDSLFVAQRFTVRNGDVVYAARHIAVDLQKIFGIVRSATASASSLSNL